MQGEIDWQSRLTAEIEKAIDSKRYNYTSLARAAGLKRNFVQQFVRYRKSPSAEAVVKICRALGVSTTYIFTGTELTAEAEEFLRLFSSLPGEVRSQQIRYLELLQAHQSNDEVPESPSGGLPPRAP